MATRDSVKTNVLIVGSGAAGVTAAIEAREAGADVIVLEKEDHLGGAAAISGGGCCLVQTALQEESGIEDSPDLAFDDWITFGGGTADEVWARYYIENTNIGLFEWTRERGVEWVRVNQNEGNSVPRWHLPKGGGAGIWQGLHKAAVDRGVDRWLMSTAARELIVDQGRVVGVRVEDVESGEMTDYYADVVVLGSGGMSSNIDMIYKYRPDLKDIKVLEGSHVGDTGDGYDMVTDVGGIQTHMDKIWFYVFAIPDHKDPRGRRGLVVRGFPDSIWVNMRGERFHNEDLQGGASGAPAMFSQDPPHSWTIIDDTMKDGMVVGDPQYYQPGTVQKDPPKVEALFEESPHIMHADTLEELAVELGVPQDAFVDTVRRYNGFIDSGMDTDPDHGRPLGNRRMLEKPPFHALHFFPLARKNFGGIKTDLQCRVVDKHYEIIPGLYVAGELSGMAGGHINGDAGLEGTMLGPCFFSGRVAGSWAAREAGFGEGFIDTPTRD